MFFNFSNSIDLFVEVFIGNQSQGKQHMQGPEIICLQQFNQLINEVAQYPHPAKVIFSQPYYDDNGKRLKDQMIIFENFKYHDEFKEEY